MTRTYKYEPGSLCPKCNQAYLVWPLVCRRCGSQVIEYDVPIRYARDVVWWNPLTWFWRFDGVGQGEE